MVLDTDAVRPHRLRASVRAVRRVLPRAGCCLPAALLTDPLVSAWVRAHGVTVHVRGVDELVLVHNSGVAPEQVAWQCASTAVSISGALAGGVTRFVACNERHLEALATLSGGAASVHLDLGCDVGGALPVDVVGTHVVGIHVVGIHCEVPDSVPVQWAVTAGRLLGRMAQLRGQGVHVTRISLIGGSASAWLHADRRLLTSFAAAVDDAIDDGCGRWRLPRPAVTLGPATVP